MPPQIQSRLVALLFEYPRNFAAPGEGRNIATEASEDVLTEEGMEVIEE